MDEVFLQGVRAAFVAGGVTGFGGLMLFLKKKYSKEFINVMLNIAAGIMLAASFYALLMPARDAILAFHDDEHVAGFWYAGAIFSGVVLIWILNALLPHEHNNMGHHGPSLDVRSAWLFVIAISLHKVPEGLALGVAYSAENLANPESLTIGIAMQNIPEGLTVAISLVAAGYSKWRAAWCSFMTGMVQPIGALIGLMTMHLSDKIVPLGMAMAGGTLLFVVINEILPETYNTKKSQASAAAVFLGFIFMVFLSTILD